MHACFVCSCAFEIRGAGDKEYKTIGRGVHARGTNLMFVLRKFIEALIILFNSRHTTAHKYILFNNLLMPILRSKMS